MLLVANASVRRIEVFRLRRVRDKAGALAVMRAQVGLSEPSAQAALHEAVGGGRPEFLLASDEAARACVVALTATGFVARFKPDDHFDPATQAEGVILPLLARMPLAIADEVGTLLLAGAWADALQWCLQHWRMHGDPGSAERALLEQASIELGIDVGATGRQ